MEPIINIKWIYLIELLNNFGMVTGIMALTIGVLFIAASLCYVFWLIAEYDDCYSDDVEKNNFLIKKLRMALIVLIALMISTSLIPSRESMYAMLASSYITEENVEKTGEDIAGMIDYIFERIDELDK